MSDAPAPGAPDRDSNLYQPPPVLGVSNDRFSFLNTMMGRKPRWEHDCFDCTWLGPWQDADLYACITGYGPDHLKIETVIARYGPEGEYKSGLVFVDQIPALGAALVRAQDYILQVQRNALRRSSLLSEEIE
jgi:hypothetical protein